MKKTDQQITGLYIAGTIQERTRRMVPADHPTTEIVTYTVTDSNDKRYYIDDYAPDSYHEVGDNIVFPVFIKPFRKSIHQTVQKKEWRSIVFTVSTESIQASFERRIILKSMNPYIINPIYGFISSFLLLFDRLRLVMSKRCLLSLSAFRRVCAAF